MMRDVANREVEEPYHFNGVTGKAMVNFHYRPMKALWYGADAPQNLSNTGCRSKVLFSEGVDNLNQTEPCD
jgi:hypothetical protein